VELDVGARRLRATLVGVQPLAFEAVTLRGHPQGLFTDVTEAVVGEELFRKDLGRGLDEWRRTIPRRSSRARSATTGSRSAT
jgi:hypothetical protein